jgi:hypothetical protein
MKHRKATESLQNNYSAGGIVPAMPTPYAHGSKYVPSDTQPPRQVPVVPTDWIGTCLSPSTDVLVLIFDNANDPPLGRLQLKGVRTFSQCVRNQAYRMYRMEERRRVPCHVQCENRHRSFDPDLGGARYHPVSYHNGSVWPHDNAMVAFGISNYGFRDLAAHILSAFMDVSAHVELHRLPELLCGLERRPGEGPTLYPVACAPQAWAAGAVFMLLEAHLPVCIASLRQGR